MDESSALVVTAARALESADAAHSVWTDADRAWASDTAARIVGDGAPAEIFVARRAELVLDRAGDRDRSLRRAVAAVRWRPWVGMVVVALAFVVGVAIDEIGGGKRINVLAPPALLLILWNLAVYAIFVAGYVLRFGDRADPGPLRRWLLQLASGAMRWRDRGGVAAVFATDWVRHSAALYGVRAARILHAAAAALAVGVIAGFYLRGIALDYQASWESTFLSPQGVHRIVRIAYAAGAAVTGIAIPSVDQIAAIRAPASENAARWLHLIAATLTVLVVVPRLALAVFAGVVERYRARRLPIDLSDRYFERLLRGFHGSVARVCVLPYSYAPAPAALAGIEAIVARSLGSGTSILVTAPIAYGSDDPIPDTGGPSAMTIALFSAAATPERDVHGAFVDALRARGGAVLLVDTSGLATRSTVDPAAVESRVAAWRELADESHAPLVVANLAAPDLAAADAALDAALSTASAAPSTGTRR